jgi:phage head maturation protease
MATHDRAARPPLEGVREAPFSVLDSGGDGLTLDGWGAIFNRETIIDCEEGRFRELIAPGAMKRSFRETPPKVQFDHGRHPTIGSIPIAELVSVAEESDPRYAPDGGAHIVARLFPNWLVEPVRDAIAAQAISGMSFRFSVVRETWTTYDGTPIRGEDMLEAQLELSAYLPDSQLPLRVLRELKVPEMGPVTWPAYADTSVSVRSQVIDLGRLHEPEQRKLLATAVFLADAATQDEAPQRDATSPVPVAVERQDDSDDEQRTTPPCVGERPSKPLTRNRLQLRQQRDTLIGIKQKGSSR